MKLEINAKPKEQALNYSLCKTLAGIELLDCIQHQHVMIKMLSFWQNDSHGNKYGHLYTLKITHIYHTIHTFDIKQQSKPKHVNENKSMPYNEKYNERVLPEEIQSL